MRRSRRLALALSLCALAAPATAVAQTTTPEPNAPAVPAPNQAKSPFAADRLSSKPAGLTPDNVNKPLAYPDSAIVLSWGDVPGAVSYSVEIADNPGFSRVVWKSDTVQPIAVPEILLPDGAYWWRVRAVDQAGTIGLWSDVARVAKTWPNQITGLRLTETPSGGPVSHVFLNPYMFWNPVPGAASYDIELTPGDQFNNVVFFGKNVHQPFATPAVVGAIPDDTYSWRVRARDANDNPGPWTVGSTFTKGWGGATAVTPADGAVTHDVFLQWTPVEGAEKYQVQVTNLEHNYVGPALKIDTTTSADAFVPTLAEVRAKGMVYGAHWWRVRPVIDGVYGKWTPARRFTWAAPAATTPTAQLTSTGDTDSGLSPHLRWTAPTGASLYRVDIATDPQFNNILESEITPSTSWASRTPLPDNQIGTGYHWRVVWGSGNAVETPDWMVDEDLVDTGMFRKQTRVTLGQPANGGTVSEPPLLTWGAVPGIAKYTVELSQDGKFAANTTRTARVFGYGAVPGSMADQEKRLGEGTWYWRARAVDGGNVGTTWSSVNAFTLTSPRPAQKLPADGATVVYSPQITWAPVSGAVGYDVQVGMDPSFAASGGTEDVMSTSQTALVPPRAKITTPGVHYWRVRADYGEEIKGAWSPTRSFRSVFPPSFNLNSIPAKVDFRTQVVVSGQLKNNGAAVRSARLYLERRIFPSDEYKGAGLVRTNTQGRFRFALKMTRSADYRLVWRESATNPEGKAAFGIDVQPRVTFRLASGKVVRRKGLLVKGSIYPKRPAVIQMRTSDGWKTLRKVSPKRQRFAVTVSTARLDPGKHRLRLWVPRDAQRRFTNKASRQRGVLVYDRFVIR
ncbi:MAG: hypothetical protein AB7V62_15040 [Thermoleophilia bacterium]